MYSGFITSKRTVGLVGVHQRFDIAAHRITAPYFATDTFPAVPQIVHFEGMNGPDGVKAKSPKAETVSHMYDPVTESGDIPGLIEEHYRALVRTLKKRDLVRAGFEAAWLAHFICDGMTPAHHYPLEEQLTPHLEGNGDRATRYRHPIIVKGDTPTETMKRSWAVWGGKGLLTTHFNFEIGVAAALVGHRIRITLDHARLAEARAAGPVAFFKEEAQAVAALRMYETFYAKGWNAELARLTKNNLAPATVQAIAIIWLLAYLEAGFEAAK